MSVLSKLKKKAKKVGKAVAVTPAAPLYALGAGVNKLTGGTGTANIYRAVGLTKKPAPRVTYSQVTRAASGYSGKTPNAGKQGLPVVNRSTTRGVGKLASTAIKDVATPVLEQTTETVFGVKPKTLAWGVAAAAAGLATVAVVRKTA